MTSLSPPLSPSLPSPGPFLVSSYDQIVYSSVSSIPPLSQGLRTEPLWSWGSILMEVGILLVYFGVCVAAMVFVEHQPQQNFTDDKAEEEVRG
jgi:hypothetical protein